MLNTSLDWDAVRKAYTEKGYVVVKNVLEPAFAEEVLACLRSRIRWDLFYTRCPAGSPDGSGKPDYVTCSSEELAGLSDSEKAGMVAEVHRRALQWYAFYYFRHELENDSDPVLSRFYETIGSERYFGFVRYVTGEISINRRNAIATCFQQGCFLKEHTDLSPAENRRVAHVFGFTKNWRPHWGGMLHIIDVDEKIERVLVPGFNTLTLFRVPTTHFVSQVATYAPESRFSITGWFTAKA